VLAFIGLLWFGALHLRASDRYVVAPGTGGTNEGPYTSWAIAATQIQWAVNAATNAGDTVWVSNGVYLLTNQIAVTSNLVLRSANGPDVTIINGNFIAGNPATNRCLFLSNSSAFVSGFTFSNGAYLADATMRGGGGALIGAGIMSNCTVRNNTVFAPVSDSKIGGGGVFMTGVSTVMLCRITDNVITSLTASTYGKGAGIHARGGTGCKVVDCLISNNVLLGDNATGAGAYMYSGTRIISSMLCNNHALNGSGGGAYLEETCFMESCTSTLNQAKNGGGCYMKKGTVTNCVISYNSASSSAGGIYMYPGDPSYDCNVLNTTIVGNTNDGVRFLNSAGGDGGKNRVVNCAIIGNLSNGVTMIGSASTINSISNCIVRENTGGIACTNGIIRNCLIVNNTNNGNVGGLLIGKTCSTALVSGCTIASNQSASAGAGIRLEATNAVISISSCIIYSNGVSGTNDVFDACAPTNYGTLQYSCVGTNPGFTGTGIIVSNPMFQSFTGGNFRLAGNSPCVNTGSNETWMTNAFDLDGRTRIRYGRVDVGAYELINDGTVYGFH